MDAVVIEFGFDTFTHHDQLSPELDGLLPRAFRKGCTADPLGKAHIILDHRAGSGLAAHRMAFNENRLQTFGGCIDRSAETSGAAPIN